MRIAHHISAPLLLLSLAPSACVPLPILTPTRTPEPTFTQTNTPEPTATPTLAPSPTPTLKPPCEPSGIVWVTRFPTSSSTEDLTPAFRDKVNRFIGALLAARASVKISETYRSRERAYLMHYAYLVARENFDPDRVPPFEGVNICWLHPNAKGNVGPATSKRAAEDMVVAYNIAYKPTLDSPHSARRAIDMTIAWQGDLEIVDGAGTLVVVKSEPRNGNNAELHKVGATYGLTKLVADPPHWFDPVIQ